MTRFLEALRREGKKAKLLKFEQKIFPMIDHLRFRRDVSDDYFKEFYNILKSIDESLLIGNDFRQKYTYIALAKSTLSEEQLIGLFYHVLDDPDTHNFMVLIEKYALFSDFKFASRAFPFCIDQRLYPVIQSQNPVLCEGVSPKKIKNSPLLMAIRVFPSKIALTLHSESKPRINSSIHPHQGSKGV